MGEIGSEELGRAIQRLQEALEAYGWEPGNLLYRDAVIKRFEFTFEIARSVLRRVVSAYSIQLKDRENITFPSLIRKASQDGVLREGYDLWHHFRDACNRTSHTYNEIEAVAVLQVVRSFWKRYAFSTAGSRRRCNMADATAAPALHLPPDQLRFVESIP